jgi:hypothetical protein
VQNDVFSRPSLAYASGYLVLLLCASLSSAAEPDSASAAEPDSDVIGNAWSDARNPIVKLYGGTRIDLWSLKPVARPELPTVQKSDWAKQDLDRFVLARLERDGIPPSSLADSRMLARRLYFDLTGLPPTLQQIAAFEKAVAEVGADQATARLVDELLVSPWFGEHFARMWLDVVRYSDSNGFDWDEFRPHAWRFRDYVVRSFNADKPYDRFLIEQLAGDELLAGPPTTAAEQDCLIATGYLRLGPHDNAAGLFNEQDRSRVELLADVTETTASAFLGLTFNCCRCHDHKYDALSHADHYRFRAFFAAIKFADDMPLDLAAEQAAIQKTNGELEPQIEALKEELKKQAKEDEAGRKACQEKIAALEGQRRAFTRGLLVTDKKDAVTPIHVLFQGNHKAPREEVVPGLPSVFDPQAATFDSPTNPDSTGRRLTLARWIASPDNPLTARVFVNRVWQQLIGRAIVSTPNDFGLAGSKPEDQALLDWLASEFVRQKWSVKQLVRMIATSATYRQADTFDRQHPFLRQPRRLSAEQLRDSMLTVSGLMTVKSGGPPIWPDLPADVLKANPAFLDDNAEKTKAWYPAPKAEQYCRSLYLVQKRNTRVPLLETFDLPDNSVSCARREVSTVAPQALMLLNGELTADASRAFAERVKREAGEDVSAQVRRAFELGLQREPKESEQATCERFLRERSLPELCRVLLNLNEFAYAD